MCDVAQKALGANVAELKVLSPQNLKLRTEHATNAHIKGTLFRAPFGQRTHAQLYAPLRLPRRAAGRARAERDPLRRAALSDGGPRVHALLHSLWASLALCTSDLEQDRRVSKGCLQEL
eukprot:6178887-Pleurochrysis_carterae.AAC.2